MKANRTLRSLDLSQNKIRGTESRMCRWTGTTWEQVGPIRKNSRKELVLDTMCDATSFQSIVESNHVCQLFLANRNNGVRETHERDFRNINALENEGAKIRYKVVLSMFKLNKDVSHSRLTLHLMSLIMKHLFAHSVLLLVLSCKAVQSSWL